MVPLAQMPAMLPVAMGKAPVAIPVAATAVVARLPVAAAMFASDASVPVGWETPCIIESDIVAAVVVGVALSHDQHNAMISWKLVAYAVAA